MVPFFMIHFGGFCAVHGMLILTFIETLGGDLSAFDAFPDSDAWPGPLIFVGLLVNVIQQVWVTFGDQIRWPIVSLLISHGISFVQNYLYRGEYRDRNMGMLMMAPYGRIVVMHVAILAAGLPVMLLGSPLPLLIILVLFKVVADISLHLASHQSGKTSALGFVQEKIFAAMNSGERR